VENTTGGGDGFVGGRNSSPSPTHMSKPGVQGEALVCTNSSMKDTKKKKKKKTKGGSSLLGDKKKKGKELGEWGGITEHLSPSKK